MSVSHVDILKIYTVARPSRSRPWYALWTRENRNNLRREPESHEEQHFRVCPNNLSRTLSCRIWQREGVNWTATTNLVLANRKKKSPSPSRVNDNRTHRRYFYYVESFFSRMEGHKSGSQIIAADLWKKNRVVFLRKVMRRLKVKKIVYEFDYWYLLWRVIVLKNILICFITVYLDIYIQLFIYLFICI